MRKYFNKSKNMNKKWKKINKEKFRKKKNI